MSRANYLGAPPESGAVRTGEQRGRRHQARMEGNPATQGRPASGRLPASGRPTKTDRRIRGAVAGLAGAAARSGLGLVLPSDRLRLGVARSWLGLFLACSGLGLVLASAGLGPPAAAIARAGEAPTGARSDSPSDPPSAPPEVWTTIPILDGTVIYIRYGEPGGVAIVRGRGATDSTIIAPSGGAGATELWYPGHGVGATAPGVPSRAGPGGAATVVLPAPGEGGAAIPGGFAQTYGSADSLVRAVVRDEVARWMRERAATAARAPGTVRSQPTSKSLLEVAVGRGLELPPEPEPASSREPGVVVVNPSATNVSEPSAVAGAGPDSLSRSNARTSAETSAPAQASATAGRTPTSVEGAPAGAAAPGLLAPPGSTAAAGPPPPSGPTAASGPKSGPTPTPGPPAATGRALGAQPPGEQISGATPPAEPTSAPPPGTELPILRQQLLQTGGLQSNLILFETNESRLLEPSEQILLSIGEALAAFPGVRIRVEGHTDSRGSEAYNLALSQRRAEVVREFLITRAGLHPEQVEAVGYGESRPLITGDSPTRMALNRRVELRVINPEVLERGTNAPGRQ